MPVKRYKSSSQSLMLSQHCCGGKQFSGGRIGGLIGLLQFGIGGTDMETHLAITGNRLNTCFSNIQRKGYTQSLGQYFNWTSLHADDLRMPIVWQSRHLGMLRI